MRRLRAALLLVPMLIAAACAGGTTERADGRIRVVATIGMITDVASRIGGDRVYVQGLMGPGVDPHLYKARAGDVRRLSQADVIFYNGLHLEAAMGEVLEGMSGRTRSVAVTDAIDRAVLMHPPEFKGAYDPHVWFDVQLWMTTVDVIADALSAEAPEHAAYFRRNAAALHAELAELDAWVRAEVSKLPPDRRVLITAHDAFNYFGRAYGFRVLGLQGISTATEAGTADVQQLAEEIHAQRIPAIFVESSIPRRTVEAVQAAVRSRGFNVEIGGQLFSDALGSAGTPEATYVGMVRHNVRTSVNALSRVEVTDE